MMQWRRSYYCAHVAPLPLRWYLCMASAAQTHATDRVYDLLRRIRDQAARVLLPTDPGKTEYICAQIGLFAALGRFVDAQNNAGLSFLKTLRRSTLCLHVPFPALSICHRSSLSDFPVLLFIPYVVLVKCQCDGLSLPSLCRSNFMHMTLKLNRAYETSSSLMLGQIVPFSARNLFSCGKFSFCITISCSTFLFDAVSPTDASKKTPSAAFYKN